MKAYISAIVSSIFFLLSVYYWFGINTECPISDIALYSGSFYFVVFYSALGLFSYIIISVCMSSTQVISLYLLMFFLGLNIAREIILCITNDFEFWINDWRASFTLCLLCLISNILLICVGRK